MNVDTFIKRWAASSRNETAASKPHFLDLCELLDVPTPTDDPDGSTYAFEKAVAKANGRNGWADVWRRECFGWEYKSRGRDLNAAYDQLLRYAGALGNPPLLITSDMARIVVQTNFTNTVTKATEIDLEALRDGSTRDRLRDCWIAPERWKPGTTRQALTERAAGDFAELAERLRKRGHQAGTVAHFVNRLVFCLFANDVRLLPAGMLSELLAIAQQEPAGFAEAASMLFRAMKEPGGRIGFRQVPWFNGGLFDDDTALPLLADDVALLNRAAANDWSQIDPSIFGTLFERGLDPSKRSQLGAHYTDRAKIELLVAAVVTRPLAAEWEAVRAEISAKMDERAAILKTTPMAAEAARILTSADAVTAETQTARKDLRQAVNRRTRKTTALLADADSLYRTFLARLRAFRVLDPACGSGNFLYVSMLDLKNLELRVSVDAEAMGLEHSFPAIGPEAVLGVEINPYAAELARVSVWIGHIQWARRHGYPPPSDPILRKLETIECRDALLTEGTEAQWPVADVIIGNPPFLGDKKMVRELTEEYVNLLRRTYRGMLPRAGDYVCFWFAKAWCYIEAGQSLRAAFVATNSIRSGASNDILLKIFTGGMISEAWSDEPWMVEGAAVRVSLICYQKGSDQAAILNGEPVASIYPNLTAGRVNITSRQKIRENLGTCFVGLILNGPFDIEPEEAAFLLNLPLNVNGRSNSDVVRPSLNGDDFNGIRPDKWIIDFGPSMGEPEASMYEAPFSLIEQRVKPFRLRVNEDGGYVVRAKGEREIWWRHARSRPKLRESLSGLTRYIATPMVTSFRVFDYLTSDILPDQKLVVFSRDDDAFLGMLQSRYHYLWTLATCSWIGAGNDMTYSNQSVYETFPFPQGLTPNIGSVHWMSDTRAQVVAREAENLKNLRDRWLNPIPSLNGAQDALAERKELPNRKAHPNLEKPAERSLGSLYSKMPTWLVNAHRNLDAAVAAAYGWPADLSDDEVLARLLALNHERAAQGR